MTPCRFTLPLAIVLPLLLSAPAVLASPPGLGSYVPANVQIFGRWRADAECDRLSAPYVAAWRKLVDSGIGKDILDLALHERSSEERAEAEKVVRDVLRLLGLPNWEELLAREVAIAMRIAMPVPQLAVLFRTPESSAAERRGEFKKAFEGFAAYGSNFLYVAEQKSRGAEVVKLTVEGGQFPIAICCATKRDVLVLATEDNFLDEVLGLMDAEGGTGSLAQEPRFAGARKELSSEAYGEFYFDMSGYFRFFTSLLEMVSGAADRTVEGRAFVSIARTVLKELSRMETVSAVERTRGDAFVVDSRLGFSQEGGPGYIENLFAAQRPLRNFARGVPKDAVGFYFSSGIDFAKVYDDLLGLVSDRIPGGAEVLEEWEGIQKRLGFHLKDDLLGWMDGAFGFMTLPAQPTGTETIVMLRVRDDERARKVILGAIDKLRSFLQSRGHASELVAAGPLENFHELRIAPLPWFRPVIGLPRGVLILASSKEAAARSVATYSGQAPNILENPRFRAAGVPESDLQEVYYFDVEKSWECLANLIGTAGFVATLLPEERDTVPIIKLGAIATKLAAFLRDIDVAVDTAGWSQYDPAKHEIRSSQTTTIRLPKKDKL
jgi:hypothetical protein